MPALLNLTTALLRCALARLLDESGFPLVAYFFTGFAPRQFLRLEPR